MGSGCCRDCRSKTKQRARTKTWATGTHEWPAFKKRLVIDKGWSWKWTGWRALWERSGTAVGRSSRSSIKKVATGGGGEGERDWRWSGSPASPVYVQRIWSRIKSQCLMEWLFRLRHFYSLSLVCSLSWWLWWYLPYKIVPYSDAASRTQQCVGSQQQTQSTVSRSKE